MDRSERVGFLGEAVKDIAEASREEPVNACNPFAREVQELEVVDQREARTDIRLIAVASAMTLERIPQVAVVGIGCDVRLLIRGDDIEALCRIASVVRGDDRGMRYYPRGSYSPVPDAVRS